MHKSEQDIAKASQYNDVTSHTESIVHDLIKCATTIMSIGLFRSISKYVDKIFCLINRKFKIS